MTNILLVGLGGFIGSVARYKMGGWVLHLTVQQKFPFGTFAVNVAGCLIAGVLAGLIEKHGLFSAEARLSCLPACLAGSFRRSAWRQYLFCGAVSRGLRLRILAQASCLASSRSGSASRSFTCCVSQRHITKGIPT